MLVATLKSMSIIQHFSLLHEQMTSPDHIKKWDRFTYSLTPTSSIIYTLFHLSLFFIENIDYIDVKIIAPLYCFWFTESLVKFDKSISYSVLSSKK